MDQYFKKLNLMAGTYIITDDWKAYANDNFQSGGENLCFNDEKLIEWNPAENQSVDENILHKVTSKCKLMTSFDDCDDNNARMRLEIDQN